MVILQSLKAAIKALSANKMRSSLTILGVVIGVAAVVALMAIGSGATADITSSIEGIGSNVISVIPGRMQGGMSGESQAGVLYYEDYSVLNEQLANVDMLAPIFQSTYTVSQNKDSISVSVYGSNENYLDVNAFELDYGRNLTANDGRTDARVAVIGSQTAEDLFGGLNPIGRKIKINGINFEVVGVTKEKGSSGFGSADDYVLIPLETGYNKLFGGMAVQDGERTLTTISIAAATADDVEAVMTQGEFLMRRVHRLDPSDESEFSLISQSQLMSTLTGVTTTLTIFLGAIAAISLLVGGIGIMNIMLVSVTERTREIGLRKAVGARKNQILTQFLVETIVLSVLGGVLGILFGIGIAWLTTVTGLIAAQVSTSSILMAFGFAVAIGVFFGIYPAYRAAGLHPMEALRYE